MLTYGSGKVNLLSEIVPKKLFLSGRRAHGRFLLAISPFRSIIEERSE